jgi:hypothetical protein
VLPFHVSVVQQSCAASGNACSTGDLAASKVETCLTYGSLCCLWSGHTVSVLNQPVLLLDVSLYNSLCSLWFSLGVSVLCCLLTCLSYTLQQPLLQLDVSVKQKTLPPLDVSVQQQPKLPPNLSILLLQQTVQYCL